jgi:hypothetical protein
MPAEAKHTFSIPSLPKVETLLEDLNFLEYSTALRNTCYDIEYLFFLEEVLNNDFLYGGFKSKLEYERLKVCFSVIESLLFCLLVSKGFLRENDNLRFPELVTKATIVGFLDEDTSRKIGVLRRTRNQHHAGAQRELHVKLDDVTTDFDYKYIQGFIQTLKSKAS